MLPTLGHDKNIYPGSGPTTETNKQKKPSNAADVTFYFFLSTSRACFSSDASSFVSVLSPTGPSLLWPMCSMLILFIPARLNSTWKCEYPRKRNSTPTKLKFNYHSFFFLSIFPLPGCFWLFLACILVLCLWKKIQSFTCFGPGGRQQLSRPTLHTHTTHTIARCARYFHTNSTLLP